MKDLNNTQIPETSVLDVNEGRIVPKDISLPVVDETSKNILFNLYHTDINAFRFFVCLDKISMEEKAKTGKEKKFTFEELCEIYEGYVSSKNVRENVERLLDVFLDVGLMTAGWELIDSYWVRVFRVRNEIAKVVGSYLKEDNAFNRYFLLHNLYFPRRRNFNFVSKVLNINSYLAHIGDIKAFNQFKDN